MNTTTPSSGTTQHFHLIKLKAHPSVESHSIFRHATTWMFNPQHRWVTMFGTSLQTYPLVQPIFGASSRCISPSSIKITYSLARRRHDPRIKPRPSAAKLLSSIFHHRKEGARRPGLLATESMRDHAKKMRWAFEHNSHLMLQRVRVILMLTELFVMFNLFLNCFMLS